MTDYQRLISKINNVGWQEVEDIIDCRIQHGEMFTDYSKQLTKQDMQLYAASQIESEQKLKRVK